jgi:hypothetical protein
LDRKFQAIEIRRAFTLFQLMTVLEEVRHSLILIEHDPMLYKDAGRMQVAHRGCFVVMPHNLLDGQQIAAF